MHSVYLLLGSNLGEREIYLQTARKLIGEKLGTVEQTSSLYETASWGNLSLPAFLNQVIKVSTASPALSVLEEILAIEEATGRVRSEKWGSRTIDIDILFFDEQVIDETGLQVPHPQLHLRKFTLLPFSEIAPLFVHPVLKKTIAQLLAELTDTLPVVRLN